MGKMNLLKSKFDGKVGTVYGSTQYCKGFVKAVPFSHAPHNKAQKEAFEAFGSLVRFAAPIAKTFFAPLFLKAPGKTNLNIVTETLKPMVKNKSFLPERIEQIFPASDSLLIDNYIADDAEGKTLLVVENNYKVSAGEKMKWFVGLYLENGKCVSWFTPDGDTLNVTILATNYNPSETFCVSLLAVERQNKKAVGYSAWDFPTIAS